MVEGGYEEIVLNVVDLFEKYWKELEVEVKFWINFISDREGGIVIKIGKIILIEEDFEFDYVKFLLEIEEVWNEGEMVKCMIRVIFVDLEVKRKWE